jgi:2-oxoglutarate ferredoxin oxidoreductase subunit gamma
VNGRGLAAPVPGRFEIRLSGLGGQGILTMGRLLGQALALGHGYHVTQTQSYGPEARGGASRADLVVGAEPVSYPRTECLDLLLALSQEAVASYHHELRPGGMLLVDTDLVRQTPSNVFCGLPFTSLARDRLRAPQAVNMVALGAVTFLLPFARRDLVRKSLGAALDRRFRDTNLKAFNLGYAEAKKHLGRPMDVGPAEACANHNGPRLDLTEVMAED